MSRHIQRKFAPVVPPAPLPERATEALRLERFKDAIELLKQLIKLDPRAEWRDSLAAAYAGRARTLAAKGMFKEAEIVLGNTAAPDGMVREPLLYLQCLIRQGQLPKAAAYACKWIETGNASATDDSQLTDLAAALSLAFPVRRDAPSEQPSERPKWLDAATAAQQALNAWIEGKPAKEIDPLLSRIPTRSAFKAVRLILKSVITAPQDSGRARLLLDGVPPGSPFVSFRDAVKAVLPGEPAELLERWSGSSAAQQSFAAEVSGVPAEASQALAQLLRAERSGPAALFSLLVKRPAHLPPEQARSACLNLLPRVPDRLSHFEKAFGPLSLFEQSRIRALAAEAGSDWSQAELHWCVAAASLDLDQEKAANLSAGVIYRHLADLALRNPEIEGNRDFDDPVIYYLELSLEVDPDHLPANLQLIALYREDESDKKWHLLADDAADRFPESGPVLLQAVDSAVARKAYKKAAGFARRLLALDPINQPARLRMIELHLSHARKQMRSKRADLAWKELGHASEWERSDSPHSLLRINHGLIGLQLDHGGEAESRLREGVQLAGGGVPGWFRASLEDLLMKAGNAEASLLRRELTQAQETTPTKESILALVSIMSCHEARDEKKAVAGLFFRIRGWLQKGTSIPWSAAEFTPVGEMFRQTNAYDLLGDYAQFASRREPEELTWRFYRIVARTKDNSDRLAFHETEQLRDMAEQSEQRNDFHGSNRIRRFLDGPRSAPMLAGRAKRLAMFGEPEEDDPLMAALLMAVGDLEPDVVAGLVADLGRNKAVATIVARITKSPLAPMLPVAAVRTLAEAMVANVIDPLGNPYF